MPSLKPSRIIFTYALVSVLWVLFSDNAAAFLFSASPSALLWANTLKGWFYVAVISCLLWVLLQRFEAQSAQQSQALKESESRYRSVVENISDVYYRSDTAGNLIMISPSAQKLLGFQSSEQLLGRSVASFWANPEDRTTFLQAMRRTGEVRDYEVYLKREDSLPIIVSTSSKFYYDDSGFFAGIEGIFRDITARKQTEEALRQSMERLQGIFDTSPSAIFLVDSDGRIGLANNRMVELFGFTQEELTGKPYLHLVASEHQNQGRQAMLQLMDGQIDHVSLERIYQRANGSLFWGHLAGRRLTGNDGLEGLVGIITDITERKSAEDALKTTHKLTNSILDSIPSAIIALDGEGRITHFNLRAQTLSHAKLSEALGAPLSTVLPQLPIGALDLETARRQCSTLHLEKTAIPTGEGMRLMDILVYPLDGEEVRRMVVIIEDVTERTRLEEMMVQSEKMTSVGGLAAGMAHEINNPLSGILQGAQVVVNRLTTNSPATLQIAQEIGCDLPVMRAFLEKRGIMKLIEGMREAAERAAHIVAGMLEFSRKSGSAHVPADVNALLDRAVELCASDYDLKKSYDFRNIPITRDYTPNLPPVPCSVTQIQQVLMNLLRNAAQSMPAKTPDAPPPAITLRTRLEKALVRIEVEDNGMGIDEATRRKIFEPFFTTKAVGEGTGLGLSVSYFIVTSNHKGTLEVESTPGKGSKFILSLPIGNSSD